MTISTVGVIGLGTMGAGIAEVIARNGYAVVAVEGAEDALARGGLPRGLHRSRGRPREADGRGPGRASGAHHVHDRSRGPGGRRPRCRGGVREPGPEEGPVRPGRCRGGRRCDPRVEHLLPVGDRHRRGDAAAGQRRGHPLLQPRTGPGRGGPHGGVCRTPSTGPSSSHAAWAAAGRRRRQGGSSRTPCCSATNRRVDALSRYTREDRRGHEARLKAIRWPAHAADLMDSTPSRD